MLNTPLIVVQDTFLAELRDAKVSVTVFLVNGFQIRGTVEQFDSFVVVINSDGKQQMVYKHAISTLAPLRIMVRSANSPDRSIV